WVSPILLLLSLLHLHSHSADGCFFGSQMAVIYKWQGSSAVAETRTQVAHLFVGDDEQLHSYRLPVAWLLRSPILHSGVTYGDDTHDVASTPRDACALRGQPRWDCFGFGSGHSLLFSERRESNSPAWSRPFLRNRRS